VHLSTQSNTTNSLSVKFWKEIGIKRINLARELSLKDIKVIRKMVPDIELEVFVHGAMCMAISGRCHLSAYLNSRSANQGLCTHPCRFLYKIKGVAVEEKQRPDRILWEYFEDEDFSSFFAAEDLCLIKYLKWFVSNKIDALKIEGRMKTSSYLGVVIDVYSTALKDLKQKRFRLNLYLKELKNATTRVCNTGFFLPNKRLDIITPPSSRNPIVFKVLNQLSQNKYLVSIRHKIDLSKELEILVPGLKRPKIAPFEYCFEDETGTILKEVNSGITCYFRYETNKLKENYLVRGNK
jgi:putative protease